MHIPNPEVTTLDPDKVQVVGQNMDKLYLVSKKSICVLNNSKANLKDLKMAQKVTNVPEIAIVHPNKTQLMVQDLVDTAVDSSKSQEVSDVLKSTLVDPRKTQLVVQDLKTTIMDPSKSQEVLRVLEFTLVDPGRLCLRYRICSIR